VSFFKPRKQLGHLLLGIWLIATGLLPFLERFHIPYVGPVLALLAIAAGALILMER